MKREKVTERTQRGFPEKQGNFVRGTEDGGGRAFE